MDIEATKATAIQLLNNHYQIYTSFADLPTPRIKSQWQAENKRGLFLGIIQEGKFSHTIRIQYLLATNQFAEQQEFSTNSQLANPQHRRTFIDDLFAHYILPFHKDYSDSSSCHTPLSSNSPSRSNSAEDLDYIPDERELSHKDLKKAVENRDGVCLFCWDKEQSQGAHIISQKNIGMAYDEPSILVRAGLTQKHQPQNGMLLCIKCHSNFDQLKRYVDVVDDKLVIKAVNYSILPNDDKHRDWIDAIETLKDNRLGKQRRFPEFSSRQAVEPNGEMALYFVLNNPTKLPNREALKFHKAACLIWRMAGGAELEDEHCPDDDNCYVPIDYRSKSIEKWLDSSATLVIERQEKPLADARLALYMTARITLGNLLNVLGLKALERM